MHKCSTNPRIILLFDIVHEFHRIKFWALSIVVGVGAIKHEIMQFGDQAPVMGISTSRPEQKRDHFIYL